MSTSDANVIVKDAGHKGKGVFAIHAFRQGDLILRFQGRIVHRDDISSLTVQERIHTGELTADMVQVLPSPRCYLNHSCVPNAVSTNDTVYAWRDITPNEEITIDYRLNAHHDGDVWEMVCHCAAHDSPHVVRGEFFTLPEDVQAQYVSFAPTFIREEYGRRHGTVAVPVNPGAHW